MNMDSLMFNMTIRTDSYDPVSYTHLDVYKRQMQHLRQRRHGHAADTDQQAGLSGNQVILKIHSKHQIS